MTEPNRELRLKLLATMEPYQVAHFARQLILETIELGTIDQFMVDAIDADPPGGEKQDGRDEYETRMDATGGIIPMGTMRMVGGEGVECFMPLNDRIREGFVDELVAKMREPLDPRAGRLMVPVVMWTNDDRDTPKMIEETLCVLEVALGEYVATRKRTQTEEQHKAFSSQVTAHIERVARLIEAARKNA